MGMAAGRPLFRRISSLRDLFPPPPSPAPHSRLSPLLSSEPALSPPAAAATARARCRRPSTPGSLSLAALEEPGGAFPNEMGRRCRSKSAPKRQIPCSGQNNYNQMRFTSGRVNRYFDVLWNTHDQRCINVSLNEMQNALHMRCMSIHTGQQLNVMDQVAIVAPQCSGDIPSSGDGSELKQKRKKLKGKRAVVRWLKFFRWKKKKEYERMTSDEKILYKLRKARKKEARLVEALKKIEPSDSSETTHDPEILTPEEHFYFLKMGHKCKNYVPIGRRGIFQGVILNMHLHWKKHQTLKVVVKTFTPEEVREIAAELARLSGGIVLDIHEENTIIMYRGKNYMQPPTEIMSPKISLSRKKALDKSKYRDALRAVRKFIPRLEQDLELLQVQAKDRRECKTPTATEETTPESGTNQEIFGLQLENLLHSGEKEYGNVDHSEDDTSTDSEIISESEALSDIFDTDSDGELDEKVEQPLYLDKFERFPSKVDGKPLDFEEHLRQISVTSESCDSSGKDIELSELDEIDRLFLQAGSLLKKRR